MNRILLFGLILGLILILLPESELFSQCAMCRANVKSNLHEGKGFGSTLNTAILYLMSIPYILISIVGYIFFKEKVDNWIVKKTNSLKIFFTLKRKAQLED